MVDVTVLYFAAASTATGLTSERVPLPSCPASEPFLLSSLGPILVSRHPDTSLAKVLEGSQWSVDAVMVDEPENVVLKGGEEIAVICPVYNPWLTGVVEEPGRQDGFLRPFYSRARDGVEKGNHNLSFRVENGVFEVLVDPLSRSHNIVGTPATGLWQSTDIRYCADGGANRLYDCLGTNSQRLEHLPDVIKGDLDSLRDDVRDYYASKGVSVIQDHDQDSTDLMKCMIDLMEKEAKQSWGLLDVMILGGLSGRLDQTVHTLHYLHKLRKTGRQIFVATDENVAWVLDEGEHHITIDHNVLGPTCGLLPVGVESTVLSTSGLRWNLTDAKSGFDGLVSTSNHLVPGEDVWIKTSQPIWWSAELRQSQ